MIRLFLLLCFFINNCFCVLTIKVGYENCKYSEKTNCSIQKAIDELHAIGGGIIELNEGIFILHNTVYP